jgi:undecaprenyl diphosphate synthase
MQNKKKTYFTKEEVSAINENKIPKHIAIIMDGNRRWAKKRFLSTKMGHKKGADNLTRILNASAEIGISAVTIYAFSTENWNRTEKEVDELLNLLENYLDKERYELIKEGVRLNTIGNISKFPEKIQEKLKRAIDDTKGGKTIDLVLALNYGSRDEITRSIKKILDDYDNKKISKNDLCENFLSNYLDTKDWPDPELLIRTSGEMRLSNFLLWQISYSEIHYCKKFWPDFSPKNLFNAILDFQDRNRRLGE